MKRFFPLLTLFLCTAMLSAPAHALFGGGSDDETTSPRKLMTSCGSPGEVCSDGTQFGGLLCPEEEENLNSCKLLFVPPYDQAILTTWKRKDHKDDIKHDSEHDGSSNQGQANPPKDFPALQKCGDLVYAGHSDWYLPAKKELAKMFENRGKIGNFSSQNYWTSTEHSDKFVWVQSFASGAQNKQSKNQKLYVRCVRSEAINENDND